MKRFVLTALLFLLAVRLMGQTFFNTPLSPRNANYDMDIVLNTEDKQIDGELVLTWTNISHQATSELQFHLYMNAFKNNYSTHIRETGGWGQKLHDEKAWGWVNVEKILVDDSDLTDRKVFIQPDDDNDLDQSVMKVNLDRPVKPGETCIIKINFVTQLPVVYRRNGFYGDDFFFAAQWFPKIGVLQDEGWNCHQFHGSSEFFADYGVYDVRLTLPREYVVGSTGVQQQVNETESGKTIHIHAEDVHDFAWTAWPHYLVEREEYNGVEIIHLYEADHKGKVDITMQAMKHTMDYLGEWVGAYPYPAITVVHPPTNCFDVAGMEYPMFVTGGAIWGIPEKNLRMTTMVTVHEFGHNWFYGMIGSNEFEEAWLDEGINSYAECRIMDHFYGANTSMINFLGLTTGELDYQRMSYLGMRRWDKTLRPAWTYIGGGYGTHSYSKPALMLWTLEGYVGRPVMDKIMHTFFQRWKFRHPRSQDFIDVVNEVTGENFDWFFDQLLKGSNELDYRVASVASQKLRPKRGLFTENGEEVLYPLKKSEKADSTAETDDKSDAEETIYRTRVRVHRQGEVIIPVDVRLVFEDGDTLNYVWDGQERWTEYVVERPSKLEYAIVDPDRKLVIDSRLYNNSRTLEPRTQAVNLLSHRSLYWFESILHLFGMLG